MNKIFSPEEFKEIAKERKSIVNSVKVTDEFTEEEITNINTVFADKMYNDWRHNGFSSKHILLYYGGHDDKTWHDAIFELSIMFDIKEGKLRKNWAKFNKMLEEAGYEIDAYWNSIYLVIKK